MRLIPRLIKGLNIVEIIIDAGFENLLGSNSIFFLKFEIRKSTYVKKLMPLEFLRVIVPLDKETLFK